MENQGNSWKIKETHRKSRKLIENQGKSSKLVENQGKSWKLMENQGAKGFMYMTVQLDRCSICSYHVTKAYDRVGSFRIKKSRCSA